MLVVSVSTAKCLALCNWWNKVSNMFSSSTVCQALSWVLLFLICSMIEVCFWFCSVLATCACDSASALLSATLSTLELAGWLGWSNDANSFLNSSSLYSSRSSSICAVGSVLIRKSSQSWPISRLVTIVASWRSRGMLSANSTSFSPTLPLISCALATILSTVWYWLSHLTAVFWPTLGIPLMPSEASPISVSRSIIWLGLIPYLSSTPCTSTTLPTKLSSNITQSLISCIMSLSPLEITTWWPSCTARWVNVPIMSSASAPSMRNKGIPKARTKRWI